MLIVILLRKHHFTGKDCSVTCKNLELYKYAGQMQYCYSDWCAGAIAVTFTGVLQALCSAIETRFIFEDDVEPVALKMYVEGFGQFKLNMTSYESFDKDLREVIGKVKKSYDED